MNTNKEKKYNTWIVILSIAVPFVVAVLFKVKVDMELPIFLPPIYAVINALTTILLVLAVIMIKNGKRYLHEKFMKLAIILSILFLAMYILYHISSDSTPYGGKGTIRYLYYFILFSHIFLSIVVIPLILISYSRAISNNFEGHKKIAKITFPIWLYVTITGVIVYIMISPYYA